MKALRFNPTLTRFAALKVLGRNNPRLYYEGPLATVRLSDVPEPAPPRPGWMAVETRMCGFCGSDLNMILLRDSPTATPFVSFPATMGHEFFGTVTDVGDGVSSVKAGDRVVVAPHLNCPTRGIEEPCGACRAGRPGSCENFARGELSPGMFHGLCRDVGGGFAPLVNVHDTQTFVLPPNVPDRAAVMTEPFAVALSAVFDNPPGPGERVLVVGGGVLGTLVVHALAALERGCEITVVEPGEFAAGFAKSAGAHHVIRDNDILGAAVRHTGAVRHRPVLGADICTGGFDRVFDTVGTSATLNASLRAMAVRGTLSVIGVGHDVCLDLTPLWLKVQTLRGVYAYGVVEWKGRPAHVFEVALELAARDPAFLASMVTHEFALADWKDMIRVNLAKGRHRAMKTVVAF